MTDEPPAEHARVRRHPERGAYDEAAVHAVLDAAIVGHVGFSAGGRVTVIPMLYGRIGSTLYLHGSVASRFQRTLSGGLDVCLTATIVDGLVLARSAFNHSMNYRSVVVFGIAERVDPDDPEHSAALRAISEHLTPGRWDEVREPSDIEIRQTTVLRLKVEQASVKIRSGGPIDEPEDVTLDIWAGVVPVSATWGELVPDPTNRSVPSAAAGHLVGRRLDGHHG
ncbi:MAG: pyridoxamine 5'-phosphate oxidase family protein [Ilumatobacteraceae bacterium]